jgi:hypothetical protein
MRELESVLVYVNMNQEASNACACAMMLLLDLYENAFEEIAGVTSSK